MIQAYRWTKKEEALVNIIDLRFSIWICRTSLARNFSIQRTRHRARRRATIVPLQKIRLWKIMAIMQPLLTLTIIRAFIIIMTHRLNRLRSTLHCSLNLWVPPWSTKTARLKVVASTRIINTLQIKAYTTLQVRVWCRRGPSSRPCPLSKRLSAMRVYPTHQVESSSQSTLIWSKGQSSRAYWIKKCKLPLLLEMM